MKLFAEDIKEDLDKMRKSSKKANEKTKEELEEEQRLNFLASFIKPDTDENEAEGTEK